MENKGNQEEFDLQSYGLVLRRRWWVTAGVFALSVTAASLAASTQKPTYQATGQLLFQSNRAASLTGVGEKIGALQSLKREGNPLDTQAVVVQSQPILQEVIDTLKLQDQDGKRLRAEELAIKVDPIVGTDVLKVSYTAREPEKAAKVVNQVMQAYINNNIKTNRAEAIAAGEFVDRQLPRAAEELEAAATALQQFRTDNQIVELVRETAATVDTVNKLDDQFNQAQTQLTDVSAQAEELQRQVGLELQQAVNVTSLSQIAGVQELLGELQKVQAKLASEQSRYTDEYPTVVNLKAQVASLETLLQERVSQVIGSSVAIPPGQLQIGTLKQSLVTNLLQLQVQRLGLERKINALATLRTNYQARASLLPGLEKQQGDLERRLVIAQKAYENLVTRAQEIRIAENQTLGNARIIQVAPVPQKPTGSYKLLLIAAGGFVGAFLGIAAAFFVDLIDRSLKTAKEAQSLYGYAVLGLIPKFETLSVTRQDDAFTRVSRRVVVTTTPRSWIHEAYQMLYANLKFSSLDKKARTIVVSSAVSQEGKSEVSANLAAAIAQSGRQVLLVDADMRYPAQHLLWGLENATGLSNAIVEPEQLPCYVQAVSPYLSVLTAGVMPPDPPALLDSESMANLVALFAQTYDYIIFDAPPLVGMADATLLGKLVDGVLLVVRPGVATTASARAAKTLLGQSDTKVLGMIVNGVDARPDLPNYRYDGGPRAEPSVEKAFQIEWSKRGISRK
jgi:polysaccharide biosynthesis transport protein